MDLPEFIATRDVANVGIAYLVALGPATAWVLLSGQQLVARSPLVLLGIAVRLALVFGLLLFICWFASIAVWVLLVGVIILAVVGFLVDVPFSGIFSFAMLYIIQQFVLGFPARHEWMLSPAGPSDTKGSGHDRFRELIGSTGQTASPLRPIGEVKINGKSYQASANDGQLIDKEVDVTVINVRAGTLLVRKHPASDSIEQ